MNRLTVNGLEVQVPEGTTVLEVCCMMGIEIPTLCHVNGLEPFTSCMLCLVRDQTSGRLVPSCTAPVVDGMAIETDTEQVRLARRQALELLLSEHLGDCEAPCRRACPAHMDIPRMIRQISTGRLSAAIGTVKRHIALPAVLGRICPAPCEKACRRGQRDMPVAICLLKRHVADVALASDAPWTPSRAAPSGQRVAIVGSGPTGLAAAYHLLQLGHECELFDEHPEPGGMLRYGVSEELLPRHVLDSEILIIKKLGAIFHNEIQVGRDVSLEHLRSTSDAVILSIGKTDAETAAQLGLQFAGHGIRTDPDNFSTSFSGVFAAGAAVRPGRMAVRAVAQGHSVALAVHAHLSGQGPLPRHKKFDSRMGRLTDSEIAELMKGKSPVPRVAPACKKPGGYTAEEALREAGRCMRCDCRKASTCALRKYAEQYGITPRDVLPIRRQSFDRIIQHPLVVYEPGKCIRCGICVRITAAAGEKFGLTFIGRGFSVRIGTPFDETLDDALTKTAETCARACPTGALALATHEDNDDATEES